MNSAPLLKGFENQIFVIIALIPISIYFIWRRGFILKKAKYILIFALSGVFAIYFGFLDFSIDLGDSWSVAFEKMVLFILLSLSTVLVIVILTIPNNQFNSDNKNNLKNAMSGEKKKTETIDDNETNIDSNGQEIKNFITPNKILEEKQGFTKKEDDFQKLINNLYENQVNQKKD